MARPWKYDRLIRNLDNDKLYNTARVIAEAVEAGLFDFNFDYPERKHTPIEKKNVMANARSSLAHFVAKYLPTEPDGYVAAAKPSRVQYPGWYGHRWKKGLATSIKNKKR